MTSILLAESLLPFQFAYWHLRKGHVARNWGILLTNSQLGTEVCSPITLEKLDFANDHVCSEEDSSFIGKSTAWLMPWAQPCETLSRGPSEVMLTHSDWRTINACYLKALLWQFVVQHKSSMHFLLLNTLHPFKSRFLLFWSILIFNSVSCKLVSFSALY